MIDYSNYNLAEMQAIVTVLDEITDDMIDNELRDPDDDLADWHLVLDEYSRARRTADALILQQARDHAAAEAEKVDRIKQACVAGAPPVNTPVDPKELEWKEQAAPLERLEPAGLRDMQSLVDGLRWCAARLAALADAEDEHFAECSWTDVCNKVILLRNCNRGVIEMLSDIHNHYDGLH